MAEAVVLVRYHLPSGGVQAEYITRPLEFTKKPAYPEESEDEESTVGKMPPIDDSDGRD